MEAERQGSNGVTDQRPTLGWPRRAPSSCTAACFWSFFVSVSCLCCAGGGVVASGVLDWGPVSPWVVLACLLLQLFKGIPICFFSWEY